MVCWLTVTSLIQYWLIIEGVLWHSPETNFSISAEVKKGTESVTCVQRSPPHLPGVSELRSMGGVRKSQPYMRNTFSDSIVHVQGWLRGNVTDAIFIIRQLQEKFLSRKDLNDKNLTLFFAFVDLEKAFDRVPRKVLWWAMRKVGSKSG